jgi:hypothetical protein
MQKSAKMQRNAKKCEMRMWCENGIKTRIALHCTTVTKKLAFLHFFCIAFASHYHSWSGQSLIWLDRT